MKMINKKILNDMKIKDVNLDLKSNRFHKKSASSISNTALINIK